jgi:excisionase family DNA binding protein
LVGVATALSPARVRPFQVFTPSFFVGLGLTLEEVAEYLNVDRFTVYRLLAQKELPAFKVGNQWRFKRELIEAWLMQNANGPRKFSH